MILSFRPLERTSIKTSEMEKQNVVEKHHAPAKGLFSRKPDSFGCED